MVDAFEVSGHCLCGAVSYKARAPLREINACHCGMCRRWTGGALMFIDSEGKPEFTGEKALGTFSSSEWGERGFCKTCGSTLFWKVAGEEHYTFTAGSLDDQAGFVFTREIFIEDKPDYYEFANDTQKQTGAEAMPAYTGSGNETE